MVNFNHGSKKSSGNSGWSIGECLQQLQKSYPSMAYVYALIGNISLVFMQINMKIVSSYTTSFEILMIRGFFLFLLNYIVIYRGGSTFNIKKPEVFRLMLKRVCLASLTVVLFLGSIKYVPIGMTNSLFNTGPIIVCFVEAFYYKKQLNRTHFVLTFLCFMGFLMILRPQFLFGSEASSQVITTPENTQISEGVDLKTNEALNDNPLQKVYMCLLIVAATVNSMSMIYLHELKGKVTSTISLHYFYLGNIFLNAIGMNLASFDEEKGSSNSTEEYVPQIYGYDKWFFICMAGLVVFAFITQNCITRAMMLKKPSYIMPFGYLSIIFSSLVDLMFFGNTFTALMVLGMALTSVGLLVKVLIPDDQKKVEPKSDSQDQEMERQFKK